MITMTEVIMIIIIMDGREDGDDDGHADDSNQR